MTLRPEPYQHLLRPDVFRRLTAFADEARARGVGMSALAIAWVLTHPCVDAAIIGPRNLSHLTAALEGVSVALSPSDRARIGSIFFN